MTSLRSLTRLSLTTSLRPAALAAAPLSAAAGSTAYMSTSSRDKPYDVPYTPETSSTDDTASYPGASSAHSAKSASAQAAANKASSAATQASSSAQSAANQAGKSAQAVADDAARAGRDLKDRWNSSGKTDVGSGTGHGVPGHTGNPVYDAADRMGQRSGTSSDRPSAISSGGAVGSKFNPDGPLGKIAEKVGGPFAKDGIIGRQFDASGGGLAGTIEKMVDGPSQKKPGEPGYKGPGSSKQ